MPRLAHGVARLGTESAFAVLARARELERLGRSIVHASPTFPRPNTSRPVLEEAGVALLAGEGFGAHGDGHLRISYANSREQLELAVDRIRDFLSD